MFAVMKKHFATHTQELEKFMASVQNNFNKSRVESLKKIKQFSGKAIEEVNPYLVPMRDVSRRSITILGRSSECISSPSADVLLSGAVMGLSLYYVSLLDSADIAYIWTAKSIATHVHSHNYPQVSSGTYSNRGSHYIIIVIRGHTISFKIYHFEIYCNAL